MGALTFLKKLGGIVLQVGAVVTGLYPLIQPMLGSGKPATIVGTAVNDLSQISKLVIQIEAVGQSLNLTGPQKLQALVPLVQNVVLTSEVVDGKKVANNDLFVKACTEYAQATVDLLNSIHPDEAAHA